MIEEKKGKKGNSPRKPEEASSIDQPGGPQSRKRGGGGNFAGVQGAKRS